MENGFAYDGLAQQLSSLTVSGKNNNDNNNNNDGLLSQVMNAVEAAEATIKQQVEENNRLRSELHKRIQELEKYKSDDKEAGSHHHHEWDGRDHLLHSKHRDALPLVNKMDGIPSMNNSAARGTSTFPLLKDPMRNVMDPAILNHGEGFIESSKSYGPFKMLPGSQPGTNKAGLYQLSSVPMTSFSPTRYQLEDEYDPQLESPGQGLVPITELNDASISSKRDAVNAWEHDQEISQLIKHLTDYSIKEAHIRNEKYVLEKRIAYMRLAFDQQQQDLVDAASKALSYRQDIIEENIRLTYALQDAQEERTTFMTYLMPLLAEYSLQPPVADAQSIASNVKVLFRHLQEKLIVTEAKLKESHYQLIAWRSDVNSNFSQSPFHSTGKNGLELVPQRAYSDKQTPISSDPLTIRDWDILGHQIGLDGEIARNPNPENLGRYSTLASRNTTSLGISAQPDLDRGNLNHVHRSEEITNKQVTFSNPVSINNMDDLDMEGRQTEGEALVNWASKGSPYTTLDDPGSSYSPYLTPVLEEPSSSFSEAADEDPLPAVESLQISGEAFPGRELQASGFSVNGTTSCNFEWVRHMEDGSVNYIDGAKQPNYLVTADDVDTYLAIEVQPMDNRKRKGELVKVFANENRKIMCDPEMHSHIERTLYTGHASYKLSLSTGYLELWEPVTLTIKRDGYSIKGSGPSGVVVTEKFYPSTIVTVPFGNPIEFSIIGSGGVERKLRAEDTITDIRCSRDTVVLILRLFIKRAGERKKGKKRGLFFNK